MQDIDTLPKSMILIKGVIIEEFKIITTAWKIVRTLLPKSL